MPSANRSLDEPLDLGHNIFHYEPNVIPTYDDNHSPVLLASESNAGTSPPKLIILCTWLGGATTPRVNKYVAGYRRMFPTAHLLLIRTIVLDITVRTFGALRAQLQPARDAISKILGQQRAHGEQEEQQADLFSHNGSTDGPNDILLHIFSHGGCNRALQLAWSMGATSSSSPKLLLRDHLRLVVFDCCPGDASFVKAYNAALVSLPETRFLDVRSLGAPLVYGAVAAMQGLQAAGLVRSVRELRRELNDPGAFGTRTRRLYLYSRADAMVAAEDVLAHAREAGRELGCRVGAVGFEEAAHCALVREDEGRYWGAIEDWWTGDDPSQSPGMQVVSKL
ncbi:hypothetical protein PG991_013920 [Apiospora marii]|uniref:Uncharacterized protein n=1 Tax=Apiospora marii TaxID=335849 RepID=A0ABR1R7Q3_9PEZI